MWYYKDVWCISKYFETPPIRIFSIVNLQENKLVLNNIRVLPTDRFLVLLTWMHPRRWFVDAQIFINSIKAELSQFYIMCNTQKQLNDAKELGFVNARLINRHFVLHPGSFRVDDVEKIYDVCVYGEHLVRNRIPLSFHLDKLALVDAIGPPHPLWQYPNCAYRSTEYLHEDNPIIQNIMRQSYTGLCLARSESICQSSIEFFLNGIPVVSTNDDTGRLEWYTEHNSIVIDNVHPETITTAVQEMKRRVISGQVSSKKIRDDAIFKFKEYALEFRKMVSQIMIDAGLPDTSKELLTQKHENHFLYQKHWKSYQETIKLFD